MDDFMIKLIKMLYSSSLLNDSPSAILFIVLGEYAARAARLLRGKRIAAAALLNELKFA